MKEELIRVLNAKLNDINKNINSLMEINNKIDVENEKLSYATRILNGFKDGETYNILNFIKLSKEDFKKVLEIIDNDVEKIFQGFRFRFCVEHARRRKLSAAPQYGEYSCCRK